ncbi:permease [Sulfurimonas sp.]|uniref:permease n=1 Tax=Sulfurimonas sp. TaxID=2022749 RepID=UPI0025D1F590|nr:permease [Sulfurimonas sp.]MCK9455525.1 permease [Sulfurimonas sp.]
MFDWLHNLVTWLVFDTFGLISSSHLGKAVHFFIYDTIKIFILIMVIIFIVTIMRSYFPVERAREYISKKHKLTAHILAAVFGVMTPFCSCSAVPLFLGFLQARIPLGVTFSYLISAPLSDAVVIALLFSLFGWKIALLYVGVGLIIAIIAGVIIGAMNLEKEVLIEVKPIDDLSYTQERVLFSSRLKEAWEYTVDIFKKIYLYVIIGVGIGAFIHGYVPTDFISKYAGGDAWYAPVVGVVMGIPMYSSAAGILPLIEVLTQKGMLLGTALSFMMAVVALSLPEAMILKRVLSMKLIAIFFGVVGFGILLVGYLFNLIL